MEYAIHFRSSVWKDLERPPKTAVERIRSEIDALAQNPRPHGVLKLRGFEGKYRIRDAELVVVVIRVGHRGSVYE